MRQNAGLFGDIQVCEKSTFIALIHPIQWTTASPVGA